MTHDEYAALPGERWTHLSNILDSGAHYQHAIQNERPDTDALQLGRAVHALALAPVEFGAEFVRYEGRRAGKAWEQFRQGTRGRTILRPQDYAKAAAMADAVRTHPLVTPYLTLGTFERPMQWQDLDTGIACKARADWIQPHTRTLIELKTTRSIEASRFGFDVRRYRYAGQLMYYAGGVSASLGWTPETILIVAVESAPPYDVGVFELDTSARQHGANEAHEALSRLAECRRTDRWPGRYSERQTLLIPSFATDDLDMGDLPEED